MDNHYARNGLVFWTEEEIRVREAAASLLSSVVVSNLKTQNRSFEAVRIEAPLLTPQALISDAYGDDDQYTTHDALVLRPETTMGSYAAARALLNPHSARKRRLPLIVWQHGKSFRREQDQPTRHMRLKEFYQLELQCLFSPSTGKDYSVELIPAVRATIASLIGPCRVEPSDRVPAYADWTQDVVCEANDMEVCSISRRHDFGEEAITLEVAVGTDRVCHNHLRWRASL